mgnify:CR=1 FL=1
MRHFNLFHGSGLLRAGALALACGLALSACKGGNGDAQAKTPGKNEVESVPVEVAKATLKQLSNPFYDNGPNDKGIDFGTCRINPDCLSSHFIMMKL